MGLRNQEDNLGKGWLVAPLLRNEIFVPRVVEHLPRSVWKENSLTAEDSPRQFVQWATEDHLWYPKLKLHHQNLSRLDDEDQSSSTSCLNQRPRCQGDVATCFTGRDWLRFGTHSSKHQILVELSEVPSGKPSGWGSRGMWKVHQILWASATPQVVLVVHVAPLRHWKWEDTCVT